MTQDEARQLAQLAIGRLFRIGSRPFQQGDLEQYEQIRTIILDCSETLRSPTLTAKELK